MVDQLLQDDRRDGRGVPLRSNLDWDKLRIFHAAAEAGSFTHAGEVLNLSQSAVSRQISALEDSLRVSLFHRHARGLLLTEQGDLLYRTTREVFAKLSMAEARLMESKERPSGPLKITTTVAFGSMWLAPRLREFVEVYPGIHVDLILDDAELDLSMRAADVAIRMSPPRQGDLVQRHLFTAHSHIYASPGYIKANGLPATPADLAKHNVIIYGTQVRAPTPSVNWLVSDRFRKQQAEAAAESGANAADADGDTLSYEPVKPIMTVNNIFAIMRVVQEGLGLGSLPEYVAGGNDNLVVVLPELEGPPTEAYFVYPEELRNSKRIAVFRDFLLRKVAECHF